MTSGGRGYLYEQLDLFIVTGGWDGERGTVTSGGRGYYLMGGAVMLQQALIQLSLHMLARQVNSVCIINLNHNKTKMRCTVRFISNVSRLKNVIWAQLHLEY